MIEIRGVSKSFASNPVLRELNLRFSRGQTHVLLGASGCGKSTLLRMIAGLIEPDKGEIRIDGQKMESGIQRGLSGKIGYVIQNGALFPHLTAEENVRLAARLAGWPPADIDARLAALSTITGLEHSILERFPKTLSGGQTQRVALMRALFLDPEILLLDEPLGALDPMVRGELQRQLHEIFVALKKTVVLVTHDIAEAAFLADDICMFREGSVIQQGSFESLVRRPADAYVTQFIDAQKPPAALRNIP